MKGKLSANNRAAAERLSNDQLAELIAKLAGQVRELRKLQKSRQRSWRGGQLRGGDNMWN